MKCVYLDANANVLPSKSVLRELLYWSMKGNPSSIYPSAIESRSMIEEFKHIIARTFNFSVNDYTILFTSGASESNSTIISISTRAFIKAKRIRPNVISTNVEHDSIMRALEVLAEESIDSTFLEVGKSEEYFSRINPTKLKEALRPNTCLVTIMAGNNETGAINDIKTLVEICHERRVPFHTDAVQYIPREEFNVTELDVDAFSMSFHKIGCPIGCGILVIKNRFVEGYKLKSHIYGTQQNEMRGGTLPIALIAASKKAFEEHFEGREIKNIRLSDMLHYLKERLASTFPSSYYFEMKEGSVILFLQSRKERWHLPNTLLISVALPNVCNIEIRKELASDGILLSIGSACKTGNSKASHVLQAIGIPKSLYPSVLRISMGDHNTREDVDTFISSMLRILSTKKYIKKDVI